MLLFGNLALAQTPSKLIFITVPSSISPGEVSSEFRVEIQDSSGEPVEPGETSYLSLESSSPSGEFSSSPDSWESVYSLRVNSNWKTRGFYYKDSTSGQVTITVRAENKSWSSASVTVDVGGNNSASENNNQSPDSSSNSPSANSSSRTTSLSSSSGNSGSWNISAGGNRRVLVGLPVEFEASVSSGSNSDRFRWSFGDGQWVRGRRATHTYYSPGVYQVVLAGKSGDKEAIARTQVEVLPADISVGVGDSLRGPVVTLINNLDEEVNVGQVVIYAGPESFFLPDNTIIDGNSSVALSPELVNPRLDENLSLKTPEGLALIDKNEQLAEIQQKISQIETRLVELKTKNIPVVNLSAAGDTSPKSTLPAGSNEESDLERSDQIILNPQRSWWQKFFSWLK